MSVRELYDGVAFEYDVEQDPWTNHYNASTQQFLRLVLEELRPRRILDVGVGSGNKILLYAAEGAEVFGLDLSRSMIRVATYKSTHFGIKPHLLNADAQALPYVDEAFDFVSCCGSVLNYCAKPKFVLDEISRILNRGGNLVIGFDNKASLDYVWIMIDALTGHRLNYRTRIKDTVSWFSQPGPAVYYPYCTADGTVKYAPERFLSRRWVKSILSRNGVVVRRTYGIHVLSSLIPFPVISSSKAKPWIGRFASSLSSLDTIFSRLGQATSLGYHLLIEGRKV